MAIPLQDEFDYYITNHLHLLEQYNGRVVVIRDHKVLGDYASEFQALQETRKQYEIGTFLIQRCGPGVENYTQFFHRAASI